MLANLPEDRLYDLLPDALVSLDEQKLIQAVLGGVQDRIDDQRAFTSKLELLVTGQGLPELDGQGNPVNNAVIAQVQSPKGIVYNRSLEIQDDTPEPDDPALITWVAGQLQLDQEHVLLSAAYGVDLLRLVDANTLSYLAATVGAVLYQTAAMDPNNQYSDARRLLLTWFPRLQFKGTAQSFDSLGRLLGFDDVRMSPLWSRLSPRVPNDIGSPANDPDFATVPDYYPQQQTSKYYNPWDLTDGPYYTWTGTATAQLGTNSSQFYTEVVNGFNPFFNVLIVGTSPADPDPALSPYILVGGGPEVNAFVNPSGTGMVFQAIAAGSSFNGMAINVQSCANGLQRVLSVTERLSSIKYRSSYYDLALTMGFGHSLSQFGTDVAQPNSDLSASPSIANFGSTALSPFRPWSSGSFTQGTIERDWITEIDTAGTQVVITSRVQAGLSSRQLDFDSMSAAGVQVVQAMEEVRPATRQPRSVLYGYLISDQAAYADYNTSGTCFMTTLGVGTYAGTLYNYPLPPYEVQFQYEQFYNGTVAQDYLMTAETSLANPEVVNVRSADLSLVGTYDYDTSGWFFNFPFGFDPASTIFVNAFYQPTSTEVVRAENNAASAISGLSWQLPIDPVTEQCAFSIPPQSETLNWDSPSRYFTLLVRGVVELKNYVLGTTGFTLPGTGGLAYQITSPPNLVFSPAGDVFYPADLTDEYLLHVSDPPAVYALNNGQENPGPISPSVVDYAMIIAINPGATIKLTCNSINSYAWPNARALTLFAAPGTPPIQVPQMPYFQGQWLQMDVLNGPPIPWPHSGYQARPEDQVDPVITDLADEYPWRRDLVSGGELVDFTSYLPPSPDATVTPVGETVAVFSQTGAQYDVLLKTAGLDPPAFTVQERPLLPYVPGQMAIAYTGTFFSLDDAGTNPTTPMDYAFQAGWQLYHFGLVQGVLVADPAKFFGSHHRDGLALWLPLDENPGSPLIFFDHSTYATDLSPANLTPQSRRFDPARGRYLSAQPGLVAVDSTARGLSRSGQMSLGFWVRPLNVFPDEEMFLAAGPLSLTLQTLAGTPTLSIYANYQALDLLQVPLAQEWVYVGLSFDGVNLSVQTWTSDGTQNSYAATASLPAIFEDGFSLLVPDTAFDLQDVRLWNVIKSASDLNLAHYHSPNPTATLYRPAWLRAANDYDRYGIRVLPSGFVSPDLLPSSMQTPSLAWVSRYDSTGQYAAQSRFKEVGLGGGNTPPPVQTLGLQWNAMTGAGTAVVSTWGPGAYYGTNVAWGSDSSAPYAAELNQAGTSFGTYATWFNTGTTVPWPNPLQATNPCRDRIWLKGDNGSMYEVTVVVAGSGTGSASLSAAQIYDRRTDLELELTGTGGAIAPILQIIESYGSYAGAYYYQGVTPSGTIYPEQLLVVSGTSQTTDNGLWSILPSGNILGGYVLPSAGTFTVTTLNGGALKVYHPLDLIYADQPTGAEVALSSASWHNRLGVNASGQVYVGTYAGSITSPPLYLYANEQTVVALAGTDALNAWVTPNAFGLAQSPPVAALQNSGEISFQIQTGQPLPAGFYRLEVTSGNIGQADPTFNGFNVVITVGDTNFQENLCATESGANFSTTDNFDFYLARSLPASPSAWLLTFKWLNGFTDPLHGTARQLFISAVSLIQLSTSLYELSLSASGSSLMEVNTAGTCFPHTPGGWMAAITSWGTVSGYVHESQIYPANDTVQSQQPVSNLLTGNTGARREDLILDAPYQVLDLPIPTLPSYGSIVAILL